MRYIFIHFYCICVISANQLAENWVAANILSFLEEAFQVNHLYSRSRLIMSEGSSADAVVLWDLLNFKRSKKGFIAIKDTNKPSLHFLESNDDMHRFKCYLNRNKFNFCEISFSRSVIKDTNEVSKRILELHAMVSNSEHCHPRTEEAGNSKLLNARCLGNTGNIELAIKFRQGISKRVQVNLKLHPSN